MLTADNVCAFFSFAKLVFFEFRMPLYWIKGLLGTITEQAVEIEAAKPALIDFVLLN